MWPSWTVWMCPFKYTACKNFVHEKILYHKIHTCILCVLHELFWCVSSNLQYEKIIYHKIHIWNLCGLHELWSHVSSSFQAWKMIFHKIHIWNLFWLYELPWYEYSNSFQFQKFLYRCFRLFYPFYHEQLQNVSWHSFEIWKSFHKFHI